MEEKKRAKKEEDEENLIRSKFTIYSITLDDIPWNPSTLNFFQLFFSWYFITFFMLFRGRRRISAKKDEEKGKNYDSHYFKFDWYSQPFAWRQRFSLAMANNKFFKGGKSKWGMISASCHVSSWIGNVIEKIKKLEICRQLANVASI